MGQDRGMASAYEGISALGTTIIIIIFNLIGKWIINILKWLFILMYFNGSWYRVKTEYTFIFKTLNNAIKKSILDRIYEVISWISPLLCVGFLLTLSNDKACLFPFTQNKNQRVLKALMSLYPWTCSIHNVWICFISTGLLLVLTGVCTDYDLFCKYFIWEKMENINQVYKAMNLEFMEDM